MQAFRAALGPEVALVCAMWANNETGVVFPVKELALLCREVGAPLFCDAAQAAGKLPLQLDDLAADLVAITGEKLGGPRGTGALFVTPGLRLSPQTGGEQERGRRGGTENPPGAVGLAAALRVAASEQPQEAERLGRLRDHFEQGLKHALPSARVNGAGAPRLASTSSITFPGTDGEALLMALDLLGALRQRRLRLPLRLHLPFPGAPRHGDARGGGPGHPPLLLRLDHHRGRGGPRPRAHPAHRPKGAGRHPHRPVTGLAYPSAPKSPRTTAAIARGVPTEGL